MKFLSKKEYKKDENNEYFIVRHKQSNKNHTERMDSLRSLSIVTQKKRKKKSFMQK